MTVEDLFASWRREAVAGISQRLVAIQTFGWFDVFLSGASPHEAAVQFVDAFVTRRGVTYWEWFVYADAALEAANSERVDQLEWDWRKCYDAGDTPTEAVARYMSR